MTQKITQDACDFSLHDEFGATVLPRVALFILLPTLAVVLRVSVKIARLATWGADDTTIVLAYVSDLTTITWPKVELTEMPVRITGTIRY